MTTWTPATPDVASWVDVTGFVILTDSDGDPLTDSNGEVLEGSGDPDIWSPVSPLPSPWTPT